LERFLPHSPDIKVEVTIAYSPTDIVADRYNAVVRPSGVLAENLIADPSGPTCAWRWSAPHPILPDRGGRRSRKI